ncbi:Cleavage/polyadenylation specificity factor [Theobroma cacao]|nr:Cleavage/polyadenylation specificity factor [Theobroma cacao]
MSYAAYKMMHWPTGIENCASGFVTHCRADFTPQIPLNQTEDLESEWPARRGIGPVPNLIVTAANLLEIYVVRVQEEGRREARNSTEVKRGGVLDGVSGVSLELVCNYRLHGNVESMAVLSIGGGDGSRRRDSIILAFQDAKISVLEFDDSIHGLRTTSMHCFEGPEWLHLKRGRESFARGPLVKVDPQGRCGGVLVYDLQMIILKASQAGSGFVGEDDAFGSGGAVSARVESSYIINLRDLDVKHIKDFIFVHGYIEPVMVILHERELTWAGRVSWKHHTCMISALSISTTLKQHPLIWSAVNLPHDAYKLLAVPSPIGGVLVISANTIHYHSQSASCALALNNYAISVDNSQDLPRSNFSVELDAANATWLLNDVALLSTKTGELLLLTLIYDGRVVQRLDLSKSKASVLTSDITTIGNSLFFLGSRLGDSLLVQFSGGSGASALPSGLKEEVGDIEGDVPLAKRLRRSSSDALQDMVGGEELSLYGSAPNNTESAQKTFLFAVRDSLTNVGPLKDFSYGLRINADVNATGIAKQSNYELVCCSGHGKNGALCVLRQSIRPEMITEVELTGCKGIWTVYHKSTRSHSADLSKVTDDDDEYHAYLIISLEARTMVYERGARILDGSFMTQELSIPSPNSESSPGSENSTVISVSIADPYVLLRMTDGSILLLVGDPATCTVSINTPTAFEGSKKMVSACTLYHDKGPEPWLRKASTDAWLSTGVGESIDGADGGPHDQGDIYCVVCYESGALEIFDVPNFNCVFSMEKFASGRTRLVDAYTLESSKDSEKVINKSSEELTGQGRKENVQNLKVVELAMQRWSANHSRPFLFGILTDGTILCYHAYLFEGSENASKVEDSVVAQNSVGLSNINASRLRNLRFIRIPLDAYTREEMSNGTLSQRITIFKNISGYQGFFLSGSRPAWFMLCDGSIVAFTVLHNVNCNHGFIYVTSQGILKICQIPSASNYDNYWPVQKNTTTKENESLLAIGTAYIQGEDVAARGRVILCSIGRNTDNLQNLVSEVYSKELKGAISALASLQGHLLIASGPKIILHNWTGSELNGIAFYDAPPLYVVSLNIVSAA